MLDGGGLPEDMSALEMIELGAVIVCRAHLASLRDFGVYEGANTRSE